MNPRALDVRFVTCADPPVPPEEATTVMPMLERAGIRCEQRAWDDDGVDWATAPLTIIRSTWDYHERLVEYLDWTDRVAASSELLNDAETVRWNSHKSYLAEFERRGVAVVPTVFAACGDERSLDEILESRGWERAVVKPAVSLGARGAERVLAGEAAGQAHFETLLRDRDVMVQPYLDIVETQGEASVVFIDGELSHTAIKRPKPGDYRVQPRHGGTTEACAVDAATLQMARRALDAVARPTLYARADLIAIDGRPHVMELELIEPALFLATAEGATERFGAAIERRLALVRDKRARGG